MAYAPNPEVESFSRNGYLLLPALCGAEAATMLALSLDQRRRRELHQRGAYHRDTQVPLAFSAHGHFDYLLELWRKQIESAVGGITLQPVNSYARIYEPGAVLEPHVDRNLLQFGLTLCAARDETPWALQLQDLSGQTVTIEQQAGDALLYRGSLLHWRDGPYQGASQTQIFLHYCDAASPLAEQIREPRSPSPYPRSRRPLSVLRRLFRR